MQSRSPMLREDASMNHDDSDLPLDLIVRTTLDQHGPRRETFHVDCPRQDHLVGTGECDSCDRRHGDRLDAHGQPNVLCELPRRKHHAASADAPISSLMGKSLECVTIDVTSDAAASLLVERQLDALAVVDRLTEGPLVLVGSSMGGWMALLVALARPERVKGLVLLAPAPDFTDRLMWASFDESQRRQIMEEGFWTRPSDYDPAGYPITRELIVEGREWNVLDGEIAIDVPVRILQGGLDPDVPWAHSLDLADKLRSKDVVWSLIKDGDHRLSRPQDIARMVETVLGLAGEVDGLRG